MGCHELLKHLPAALLLGLAHGLERGIIAVQRVRAEARKVSTLRIKDSGNQVSQDAAP